MDLKNSKTYDNLMAAFAGESQARNKYTYYASKARKDGFEQIANIFEETAQNEKEHAEIWFKLIHEGMQSTPINLEDAAKGEHFEWSDMYLRMAREAEEEGFTKIANLFRGVAKIEHFHEERFNTLLSNINNNQVFKKPEETTWICSNCGHIHHGKNAPDICPVCAHAKAFFEELCKNY